MLLGTRRVVSPATALACLLATFVAPPTAASPQRSPAPPAASAASGTCVASVGDATFVPPSRGVTAGSGLGPGAPAYYEVGAPTGKHRGREPVGIMIVIHGGGWYLVGKEVLAVYGRPMAQRWRRAGWMTVNVDYRACAQSIGDVLWFMGRVRALYPRAVICATGESAGGHLALLLATQRKDLACAISHAGPTDLLALPPALTDMAVAAFGAKPNPLVRSSPRRFAAKVRARILLATGEADPLVPPAQDASFARALRAARPGAIVEVLSLPPGPSWFVHTGVTQRSLEELRRRENALVAPLLASSSATKVGKTALSRLR